MNPLVCIAVLLFAVALKAPAAELPLLPYPQQLQLLPGELRLGSEWSLKIDGKTAPELHASLQRLQTRIVRQTGVALALKPGTEAQLHIRVRSGKAMANNLLEVDESYRLHIHGQGIAINAQETLGAMRALETLAQLIQVRDGHFYLPQVMIEDAPRFAWRGLLLDTSRHFFSVASIKRQLDMMAAAKYNLFHWHLTDDQGWRIESKRFPKLQQLASDGEFYTQTQIKEVVAYARERGIQVLPEIDMPGHASAIAVAYPELMSAPGPYAMEYRWGVHQPTLNPANEAVYQFIEQLLGEVAALFPFDYVHIGGDEVDPQQWQRNSRIQQFMRAQGLQDHLALQAYFNRRVQNILRKHQRKMIGWDEIQHGDLPRDIIIHSWQGPDGVSRAVRAGFKAILSTGYYLDQPQTAAYHYRQDPLPPAPVQVAAPAAGELWHSWSFSLPRKRGKPIEGSFTLIGTGKNARGFIDFAGKSRRALAIQQLSEQQAVFGLDTWMGPVQFEVQFNQQQFNQEEFNQVQGQAWVGNAAYPLTGQQIAGIGHPQQQLPPPQWRDFALSAQQQALVLGGEAALWSEIVDEQSLDLRLWPRALAVAERLWSAADCCAESDFYRRAETTMSNARSGLGLQDQQQQQQALKRLAGNQSHVLAIFSEALEPAHYYHRQHEKSARETYSKADPLNRLVDALPAENLLHRELLAHWQRWLAQGDEVALTALKNRFKHWQNNHDDLMALLRQGKDVQGLQGLEKLAKNLHWVSGLGLQWLAACQGKPWSEAQRQGALQQLAQARGMQQEILLSTATLVQHMLQSGAGCVR